MNDNLLTRQLQKIPWTIEQKQFSLSKLKKRKLDAMELLLREGEVCEFEAFIEEGILRSFYKKNEEERINQFFFEGQWASDYQSFISQLPSKASIQALESCELLVVSKKDIDILGEQLPNWDTLAKTFFEKLYLKKEKRTASLLLESAEEKYLAIVNDQPQLIHRIPQYYIAQYIGIKPESLSRIRKKLTKKE